MEPSTTTVRVDLFKRNSGKWKETISVAMRHHYFNPDIDDAVRAAIIETLGYTPFNVIAVCLTPHHQFEHPTLIIFEEAFN